MSSLPPFIPEGRGRVLLGALAGLVVTGVVVGLVVAWLSTRVLDAAGLDEPATADDAQPQQTTPEPPPDTGPTPEPSQPSTAPPSTTATTPGPREPTLTASPRQVATYEPITLAGRFPGLVPGTSLQIERRIGDSAWELFPVSVTSGENGTFSVVVETGQTGRNEFRLTVAGTVRATPDVSVLVG